MNRTIDQITEGRRLRRLRKEPWIRELVQENHVKASDFILPIFLCEGNNIVSPISRMPNVNRFSVDRAVEECVRAYELGIRAVAPFAQEPLSVKCDKGLYVTNENNLTNRFTRALKQKQLDMGVIVDVALDPYTTHGHDGLMENGKILNDATVDILCQGAIIAAQSGADIIAPSDMMDGRIGAIRDTLDAHNFHDVAILAYTAKFSSSFYGPYREAIGTDNLLKGDKKTYYINPANSKEALKEALQDEKEGADMLMVKPGMPYLDVIQLLSQNINLPIFAYQVSGEYSMLRLAIDNGYLKEQAILESLLTFKRAGCSAIFTYFAKEAAVFLQNK